MSSEDPQAQQRIDAARLALRPGATLLDLARALGRPAWLAPEDVQAVVAIAGKIPVRPEAGDSVLVLRLAPAPQGPAWALYMRVGGPLAAAELLQLLHLADPALPCAGRRILELAWVETPR